MTSLINDEELMKHTSTLISEASYKKEVLNQEIKWNWSSLLEDFQRLRLDLNRAQREIANLEQKLSHARRNLEEEKRKRRTVEQQRDLLERYIDTARNILFHSKKTNLDEGVKERLQFLDKIGIEKKWNLCAPDAQSGNAQSGAATEMNSTGSILSDLNCLSKSEDDVDINAIFLQTQKQWRWKEHKSIYEYPMNKQCGTLDKVAEFNSLDKVTILAIRSNGTGARAVSPQAHVAPINKTTDIKMLNEKKPAHHNLVSKMILKPETCIACDKRIRFGRIVLTCKNCSVTCHTECKLKVLHPCVNKEATLCALIKK